MEMKKYEFECCIKAMQKYSLLLRAIKSNASLGFDGLTIEPYAFMRAVKAIEPDVYENVLRKLQKEKADE